MKIHPIDVVKSFPAGVSDQQVLQIPAGTLRLATAVGVTFSGVMPYVVLGYKDANGQLHQLADALMSAPGLSRATWTGEIRTDPDDTLHGRVVNPHPTDAMTVRFTGHVEVAD